MLTVASLSSNRYMWTIGKNVNASTHKLEKEQKTDKPWNEQKKKIKKHT